MKIICTTTFLDGPERFESGDVRTVDDARGAYFAANGWASPVGAEPIEPASGDVTLAVQSAVHIQGVSHG